jgi:O-6-methylguanine DNA methyltransferase
VEAVRSGHGRELAYDLRGVSDFEHAVLRKALEIPRGELRPYAWVAREIGRPRAVRAVGSALGHNPVPVLIPCHRVVLSDGGIGEYVFGPSMKRALLDAEAVDLAEVERLARAGARLVGSDATRRFCYPTCRVARRLADPHRVAFRSAGQARSAGYQPCADCRPDGAQTA